MQVWAERLRWLVAMAVPLCACRDTTATYSLDQFDAEDQRIHVSLMVRTDALPDTLLFHTYDPAELTDIQDLRGDTESGPILIQTRRNEVGHLVVTGVPQGSGSTAQLRYSVRVGAAFPTVEDGKVPRHASGAMSRGAVLVSGRGLGLASNLTIDAFEVHLPEPWRFAAPHQAERAFRSRSEEEFANTPFAIGAFTVAKSIVMGDTLRVVVPASMDVVMRAALMDKARSVHWQSMEIFGQPIDRAHSVIFAERTDAGHVVSSPASVWGQVADVGARELEMWVSVAGHLASRWMMFSPRVVSLSRMSDAWILPGAAGFTGVNLGSTVVGADRELVMEAVYRDYNRRRLSMGAAGPTPLQAFRGGNRHSYDRALITTVLADRMNAWMIHEFGGDWTFDELIAESVADGRLEAIPSVMADRVESFEAFSQNYIAVDTLAEIQRGGSVSDKLWRASFSAKPLHSGEVVDTLTVILTGGTESYLETCGCEVNQSGGVARRSKAIGRVRSMRRNVMLIDAGNSFPDPSKVAKDPVTRMSVLAYFRAMRRMAYDAIAIAENEVIDPDLMREVVADSSVHFTAANLNLEPLKIATSIRRRWGDREALVVGVFEEVEGSALRSTRLSDALGAWELSEPWEHVEKTIRGNSHDMAIVVGRLGRRTVNAVAASGLVDLVVQPGYRRATLGKGSQGLEAIVGEPEGFRDGVLFLNAEAGVYGMHMVDLLLDEHGRIVDYSKSHILLSEWIDDDPVVRTDLEQFYASFRDTYQEGDVDPLFGWDASLDSATYSGTDECAVCHESQYRQWRGTGHGRAYKTLLDAQRHFVPTCLKCHVVGLGRDSGYEFGSGETNLSSVGCEVCHGPGDRHVASGEAGDIRRVPELRLCRECHIPGHDDDFNFERDFTFVSH